MTGMTFTKTLVEKLPPPSDDDVTANGKPVVQSLYWDDAKPGLGLRVSKGGARAYIYQGRLNGSVIKLTIGRPDDVVTLKIKDKIETRPLTVQNARLKVDEIRGQIVQGKDPRQVKRRASADACDTFGDLLDGYADMLERQKKVSAHDVRVELRSKIGVAHPKLWKKRAADITMTDVMTIVSGIDAKGHACSADRVRRYIKTAFKCAMNARGDVKQSDAIRAMSIIRNPAADVSCILGSTGVNERVLSLSEFRSYWQRIQDLPEPRRSIAMLHVLTGGQRMKQLSRVTLADIDRDALLMRMSDAKGRRKTPRVYHVPLRPEALACIDAITGSGQYVFSANGGKTPISGDQYISDIAKLVCKEMQKAGDLEGEPFTGKTMRATIETRLMDEPYEISSDVLARLLSHGLGGVQAKHYARDPLLSRQRKAIDALWRLLHDTEEAS